MSVRTNFIDAGFAILNGAPTFLTLAEDGKRPHDVRVVLPPGWKTAIAALPSPPAEAGEEDSFRFRAEDFDALVDAQPIYVGNPAVYEFEVGGRPHFLVNEGEGGSLGRSALRRRRGADRERAGRLLGVVPYPRYVFFNLLVEAGGGPSTATPRSSWRAAGARASARVRELAGADEPRAVPRLERQAPPPRGSAPSTTRT